MKFLAVDCGQKRTGLAISDDSETFALPLDTLEHAGSRSSTLRALKRLVELVQREEVGGLVFGLPKSADGSESEMEIYSRRFADELAGALQSKGCSLETVWWDERFSTASVLKNLRAAGISQKSARAASGKDSIDARAAAVILQDFLDARKLRATFELDGDSHQDKDEDHV